MPRTAAPRGCAAARAGRPTAAGRCLAAGRASLRAPAPRPTRQAPRTPSPRSPARRADPPPRACAAPARASAEPCLSPLAYAVSSAPLTPLGSNASAQALPLRAVLAFAHIDGGEGLRLRDLDAAFAGHFQHGAE